MKNLRKKAAGLIWFLLFLALFEVLVARNCSFYQLAPYSSIGQMAHLLKTFAHQDSGKIRWLLVGDSQSRDALRPELIAQALGCDPDSIFNLSINGGKPVDFKYLLRRTVPRLPHLQGVIINVNEHYFDRGELQHDPKFRFLADFKERMLIPGPERKADLLLSWAFYTYGMRTQWWEITKMLVQGKTSFREPINYAWGLGPQSSCTEENKTAEYAKKLSQTWMYKFRLPGPQKTALEETVSYLTSRNISWTLIHLPKTSLIEKTLEEKYPQQRAKFDGYMEKLAQNQGTKYINKFTGITDDCFRDVNHMNGKGASIIAPQVGEVLGESFGD